MEGQPRNRGERKCLNEFESEKNLLSEELYQIALFSQSCVESLRMIGKRSKSRLKLLTFPGAELGDNNIQRSGKHLGNAASAVARVVVNVGDSAPQLLHFSHCDPVSVNRGPSQ